MGKYASNTTVSSELSRMEIEKTLMRYGADGFMYATDHTKAAIVFKMNNRQIKFILPMPDKDDFQYTETGRKRVENSANEAYQQACRQRWRALNLVIKAKLEAVECGISVFDDEFMANIMLPNGETVSQFMIPQIEQAYISGKVPNMLMLE